ncbi:dynein axonemal heavy chain 6 isoform X3 [Periplaneta americana]|uniref:dynein axonemal heavy chain 6 isoform X3 n=1 Tax=Periplaneta americana TaxID=6978 RepID=UPI0037E87475
MERQSGDTPLEEVLKKIVTKPPVAFARPKNIIPFHIPHKKVLAKYEEKAEIPEPVPGFSENQRKRRKLFLKESREELLTQISPSSKKAQKAAVKIVVLGDEETRHHGDILLRRVKKSALPDIVDQKEIIQRLRSNKDLGFFYMIYAVSRASEFYTPYCLTIVGYDDIDKSNFLTISGNGVTQYYPGDMVFTPLDVWEREYDYYCKLIKINAFKKFRMWKGFYVWRKYCVWRKFHVAQDMLEHNLFILNPILQKALLDIRKMCCKLINMSFSDTSNIQENALFGFIEVQMGKLESVQERITEFHSLTKELVNNACHGALLAAGYTVDDSNFLKPQSTSPYKKSKDKGKMSYIEQANKRRFCVRLSCFIHLADYMMLHLFHVLSRNSLEDMVMAFRTHFYYLPSDSRLKSIETYEKLEDPRPPDAPQLPMFIVDVLINPEELSLDPCEQVFLDIFNQIMDLWDEAITGLKPLVPDPFFKPFTEPMINGKVEERLCGDGPVLSVVLSEDIFLVNLRKNIIKFFNLNFEAAMTYIQRFQDIREFYAENELKDHSSIKNEKELEVFRILLTRYHLQIEEIERIVEEQALGILHLWFGRFKEAVLPSPTQLLSIVEYTLPRIGKEKINTLIGQAQHAQSCLQMEPVTTLNYVEYLSFLEKAPRMVDEMEIEMDYTKELYDIIDEFQVPAAPEEQANYLGFQVTLTALRNLVDRKVNEKTKMVGKFNEQINKDITDLLAEVGDIKEEANQPWLIDIESNPEEAKVTLDALHDQLAECQKKATEFRNYQKTFRMEVTRFDMLDDVMNGVKLRQLLWDSVEQWEKQVAVWTTIEFDKLNPEEMNVITAKNVKNIHLFEKGLPPNLIVPKLDASVEMMKEKLPVITYLRNPSLKQRHWMQIERILDYKFQPDEVMSLLLLESVGVFEHDTELQEVSGQASSEAALESLLRKVEDNWKALEFAVLPHRDYKDVYILGGIEEVQQILDDSFININTIASSRHVGPIKYRVDEWLRQLDLFSKTLDEWLACQQSWLYLEPIFSAPDIQRQLPNEAKMFLIVDKSFKEIMRRTNKMPLAMPSCTAPGVLEMFQNNNALLEQIMKCLDAYLESKRVIFPRFYFLSNEELLEILAQTRNPHAVQPHLRKCFDAIAKLEFGSFFMSGQEEELQIDEETEQVAEEEDKADALRAVSEIDKAMNVLTTDIIAMISPEGEKVGLGKGLKARGNVEDWLGKVEDSMFISLKKRMMGAMIDYEQRARKKWVLAHPSQIILTVSQIMWARDVHNIFESKGQHIEKLMKEFEEKCFEELNNLAAMVRGDLYKLQRMILCSLITIEVHARDNVTNLVNGRVTKSTSFEWLKQLRYYWDKDIDNCLARMSSAAHVYGYEYLGASPRLVITPLTDKCYLCLMGALQLDLGGAPAGPAGTGKTETTKDLAKSLAIQCVVFNCSEGLDYKMMGRFFSGLAQSGAWCCFDEFNRIDIEVLSVIAQQLITIRNAKAAKLSRFMFEGREIKLVHQCAAFITMNPGYAGRTELPDNLKALFRPISMMVPDYALIAEVILYSEGFESSKLLANKMTQMYKLCSEQLSQQDHYDFGMRAVKSVLVMAGSLKRDNPKLSEDVVLIRALRDSNLPKFLAEDSNLFQGILNDLFPGITIPEQDYGVLQEAIVTVMEEHVLQPEPCLITKVIQLHETMIVRHGVMLVGPTGGGKTTVLQVLKNSLTKLYYNKVQHQYYKPVKTYVLNPKSVTLGELYGEVNPFTLEWRDGLLGIMVRTAVQCETDDHQWIVCDGPVDAVWIENMNTVLDDNKMLCLANSERIKLTPYVHMVFEVQDLAQASPATVSRCGMVYIDPDEIKWLPYVKSWLAKLDITLPEDGRSYIEDLFSTYVEEGFVFIKKNCDYAIHQVDISKATMMCKLMESLMRLPKAIDVKTDRSHVKSFICQAFVFSYMWSLGGNIIDSSREMFEVFVRTQFEEHPDARIPSSGDLWNVFVSIQARRLDLWERLTPLFQYNPAVPFFDITVPTTETIRMGYIMERLLEVKYPVLFTGLTGVGKSVIAKSVLNKLSSEGNHISVSLNFSAQTSSAQTQEIIESKLEKRKKTLLGPPLGKKIIVFVDDVNMPKLDTYGSQPPIELLRQYLDFHGLFDREKLFWKDIEDVTIAAACAPPGGGRNPLTPRFVRHFGMLLIPSPDESTLKHIFKSIMRGFLDDFSKPVADLGGSMVNAAVEIYDRIATDLLPTPTKSHYVFNLRDLSKCIQGVLQADSGTMREPAQMLRLFYHECLRVFHDRLINIEDKSYFFHLMKEICIRTFSTAVIQLPDDPIIEHPPVIIFGDFMQVGAAKENKIYEEITNMEKLNDVLQDYLEDYNITTSKEMKLIFFMDALEHVARIARILRAERGNGLLVGVSGMGKQSLTRMGAHLCGYKCFQLELTRNYDINSFHDDLRRLYFSAGAKGEDTTFLFPDTQIVQEEFLEDINNILNSGEVPNLFDAAEEMEKVIQGARPNAKDAGISDGDRDRIFSFFINRVRRKLHLVLCMSPVGDAFRRRCRMFPSLVNCCTIDWFVDWPQEALLSVAMNALKPLGDEKIVNKLANVCVTMHKSVAKGTVRFYEEMRRHYYTTPSSYLELIKLYKAMLEDKKDLIIKKRDRISNGLQKLFETNSVVDTMKAELVALEPELKEKSAATAELMKHLVKEQSQADKVRQIVLQDEQTVKTKAAETQVLADDAQRDLDAAMPAMEAATKALDSLNKNDINELRVFNKPPHLVKFVMEAVCLLLGQKLDWASAKLVLGDTNFLKKLQEYEKDKISDALLKKLKDYVEHPDFIPDKVATQSKVCKSMCMWVRAIDMYAKVYRVVEPKRKRLEEAERELNQVMGVLREKQQRLAEVEKQIAQLEASYDASLAEKTELERVIELTANRLTRAGRLTSALGDEQTRWEQTVKELSANLITLVGDVLVAAGCVAYLGPFTNTYREELMNLWISHCKELMIPASETFSLIAVLADSYAIRQWNTFGLPRDRVSTENAILVTKAGRWPLMIDPQEQANRWIRNMESSDGLKIVKLTDSNFMRVLETAIRLGNPVLLEEIGETLDPTLGPVLTKQTFVQGGRTLIRLGDSDVDYDENFRFYVTTKLPNPHYLPEICIQVTLVNFTVTPSGLEEQLLSDVVRLERPDLETQRNDLITRINNDKNQLQNIEDKILKMLYASEGNILDDEDLIDTLNESKETAAIIASRLVETEATEEKISIAREKYRLVATRGSVLYFVVAQLADIDPMYQYSLKYFNQTLPKKPDISTLSDSMWLAVNYLHNKVEHFQGLLSDAILKIYIRIEDFEQVINIQAKNTQNAEINWNEQLDDFEKLMLLKALKEEKPFIQPPSWRTTPHRLSATAYSIYSQLPSISGGRLLDPQPEDSPCRGDRDPQYMLVFAITSYVKGKLGQEFVESPQVTLQKLYQDTSNLTPLVFVLSTGSDPFESFQRFASDMGNKDRIQSISLGQGQGPVAEKLISLGIVKGDWVFLQNCHLATSWMLPMERHIQKLSESPEKVHSDFRLFLSSMPSKAFPVSVLQNSVKVTNEPPKGLRANMKRAFLELTPDVFEDHPLGPSWRKMIFGICFFHAVIQERKKFGPLGWNITYEFNDSDRQCALSNMKMFCSDDTIPWDALEYITGEITYGGRVTDYWDLRCLKTILQGFFSPHTLVKGYLYSKSGVYYCPEAPTCSSLDNYRDFIDKLPLIEEPEIFGMHENANIAFQVKETQAVIVTIMEVQPRESSGSTGKSSDDIVYELAEAMLGTLIEGIDPDDCLPKLLMRDEKGRLPSLSTVLFQEVDRYNKLLVKVHASLDNLQKAIKGLIVMSEALEDVFKACLNNQVPKMWSDISYPSLKSLGSWVGDLELRLDFIKVWLTNGAPTSYWLSGFFFPQGFLTGILQTYARKYDEPIDILKFEFKVLNVILDQEDIYAAHMEREQREVPEVYGGIEYPKDGVLIHGLFLDAGRWDKEKMILVDPNPGEMNPPLPVMHLLPQSTIHYEGIRYVAPLYKTSVRAGVLSTTGHSTNFVVAVLLPSTVQESYWILKGTALLTQITD